jgi:hypothetical protein
MIYIPNGKVQGVEAISGPRLLSNLLRDQLSNWAVKTDARGEELCETLVIANFRLRGPGEPVPADTGQPEEPSILRLSIDGEWLIISDPAIEISKVVRNPFVILGYKMKRAAKGIFGRAAAN